MSLNKDKQLEIDVAPRKYDFLSSPIPTTHAQASKAIVGNSTMEENYAFNNVHHIYDQVHISLFIHFFMLVIFLYDLAFRCSNNVEVC